MVKGYMLDTCLFKPQIVIVMPANSTSTLRLTEEEKTHLETVKDEWPMKTKQERTEAKEAIITKFLKAREHDDKDVFARSALLYVSRPVPLRLTGHA